MSRSESAFLNVADELRKLRSRVVPSDADTINRAVDLLTKTYEFFEDESYDDEEFDEAAPPPVAVGDPPAYMQLFCIGDVNLFAISVDPLTPEQQAELSHRCSFPLELPLNPGIEVASIEFDGSPSKPIYDKDGKLIGTAAEIIELPGLPPFPFPKGGEA